MQRSAWWLVLVACGCFACDDERDAPPAAPVNGDPRPPKYDTSDAGSDDSDSGAGPSKPGAAQDAGVPISSCVRVRPLAGDPDDSTSATVSELPADFSITRQAERWSIDDCLHPKLTLELSNGVCPRGLGHQLSFEFDLNAIADGAIRAGNNELFPDRDSVGLRVRYQRPNPLSPNGTWGSCTEATGQVVFLGEPSPRAGAVWNARYELNLTPCDGSTQPALLVMGSFRHVFEYGLARYCSDRME